MGARSVNGHLQELNAHGRTLAATYGQGTDGYRRVLSALVVLGTGQGAPARARNFAQAIDDHGLEHVVVVLERQWRAVAAEDDPEAREELTKAAKFAFGGSGAYWASALAAEQARVKPDRKAPPAEIDGVALTEAEQQYWRREIRLCDAGTVISGIERQRYVEKREGTT